MQEKLSQIEGLIKTGQGIQAKDAIASIEYKKLSEKELIKYANLARRLKLPQLALKALNPIIRGESSISYLRSLNKDLVVEYAGSLFLIGAVKEGRELLSNIKDPKPRDAYLFLAFSHFGEWEYKEALPYLEQYSALVKGDPYWERVANINLAAALIAEGQFEKASPILESLINEIKPTNNHLLLANCLELKGQMHCLSGNYKKSELVLSEASEILKNNLSHGYKQFAKKWKVINRSLQTHSHLQLVDLKSELRRGKQWENLRQVDLFIAQIQNDGERAKEILFKSPQSGFRRYIENHFAFKNLDNSLGVPVGSESSKRKFTLFNPITCQYGAKGTLAIKKGQLHHRLLMILMSDLYKPFSIGRISSHLYPDEYYDPINTPGKVHQIILRLRKALKSSSCGIELISKDGPVHLKFTKPLDLQLPREWPLNSKLESKVTSYLDDVKPDNFTVVDISCYFKISKRAGSNLVKEAVDSGIIIPFKFGSKTKYKKAC